MAGKKKSAKSGKASKPAKATKSVKPSKLGKKSGKSAKRARRDEFDGLSRADDHRYGKTGVFRDVAVRMNELYHPDNIAQTAKDWASYVKDILHNDLTKHTFGKFAAYKLKFDGSDAALPEASEWQGDTAIAGPALAKIKQVIIDNLGSSAPRPMVMVVKATGEGQHSIGVREPVAIGTRKDGIEVTIFCPD